MKLFEPGKLGKLSLKNRIVMAPMVIKVLAEPDGTLSQRGLDYYIARAKGGVGLIITGATRVTREIEYPQRRLRVDGITDTAWLRELADAVHTYETRVAVQLTAGVGRVAAIDLLKEVGAVAPSALPCFWDPSITARELTIDEIERLIDSFQLAAH